MICAKCKQVDITQIYTLIVLCTSTFTSLDHGKFYYLCLSFSPLCLLINRSVVWGGHWRCPWTGYSGNEQGRVFVLLQPGWPRLLTDSTGQTPSSLEGGRLDLQLWLHGRDSEPWNFSWKLFFIKLHIFCKFALQLSLLINFILAGCQ